MSPRTAYAELTYQPMLEVMIGFRNGDTGDTVDGWCGPYVTDRIERRWLASVENFRAMPSHWTSFIRDHLFTLPVLAKFAIGMVMLVTIPRLSRRIHIPGAVGLLLGGVIVGPYVLGIFGTVRPIADFLAALGKLLLMFFAGLEIDLALFRRARNRSIALGIVTTCFRWCLAPPLGLCSDTRLFPQL